MKKTTALALCLTLLALLFPPAACPAEAPSVTCTVTTIQDDCDAELDITIEDFERAGFEPGDIITVKSGSFEKDMPMLNGYYVEIGECLVNAYPLHTYIELSVNYGDFAEVSGVVPGDTVTLTMKEKGGALAIQEAHNLVYTDNREDYASDEIFANFRAALPGKLYRSASPVDNIAHRAAITDRLVQEAGIRTVLNLSDTEEDITAHMAEEDFASPYYKALVESGSVLPLKITPLYTTEEIAEAMVKGFTFLAGHDTPFLIHCVEGKDRTGFAVLLLEMLAGFTEDEMVADYMLSYVNYYGLQPGTERYRIIAGENILEMLAFLAGTEKENIPEGFDWKAAAEQYLLSHGMSTETLAALEAKLK